MQHSNQMNRIDRQNQGPKLPFDLKYHTHTHTKNENKHKNTVISIRRRHRFLKRNKQEMMLYLYISWNKFANESDVENNNKMNANNATARKDKSWPSSLIRDFVLCLALYLCSMHSIYIYIYKLQLNTPNYWITLFLFCIHIYIF